MKELPKPKNKLGYTGREIKRILKDLGVKEKVFWKVFGVNTCGVLPGGEIAYFPCDVALALTCIEEKRGKAVEEWD